jgi:hypothetical protein
MRRPTSTSWRKDRFAAETAEMLKQRALRNEFESLIIVAPPRTLGELRKHYHKEVQKAQAGECTSSRRRPGPQGVKGRRACSASSVPCTGRAHNPLRSRPSPG